MSLKPHVIQRFAWIDGITAPTKSVQRRPGKLNAPQPFWSEKTVTTMKFGALALASALLPLAGCSKSHEPDPRTQPIAVLVAQVGAPAAETESFTGVVTARVQSDLGFRVPGKVTKRFVDTGQKVHMGQPLMQIDVTDFAHAIATQTENVAALRAKAKQAAADEVRYRGLVSTGAIAASTYDQVKATADAAQAQLASAEAQEKVARDQGDYSLLVRAFACCSHLLCHQGGGSLLYPISAVSVGAIRRRGYRTHAASREDGTLRRSSRRRHRCIDNHRRVVEADLFRFQEGQA